MVLITTGEVIPNLRGSALERGGQDEESHRHLPILTSRFLRFPKETNPFACVFLLAFDVALCRSPEHSNAGRKSGYDIRLIVLPLLQWRTEGRFYSKSKIETKIGDQIETFFCHRYWF